MFSFFLSPMRRCCDSPNSSSRGEGRGVWFLFLLVFKTYGIHFLLRRNIIVFVSLCRRQTVGGGGGRPLDRHLGPAAPPAAQPGRDEPGVSGG